MTITLELEPDVERGLQEQAQASGVTLESRNLGDMGSLHRRDIYDDVR
jgi:hypothetical protein